MKWIIEVYQPELERTWADIFYFLNASMGIANGSINRIEQLFTGKADKVSNVTSGNLAGLDANGNLTDSVVSANQVVVSSAVRTVVMCTQAQYDALATKDANTQYNIIESV